MTAAAINPESSNMNAHPASVAVEPNRFVKYGAADADGNPTVAPCTAITDIAIGVSTTKAAIGEMCEFMTRGVAKVACSAGVTALDQVMATASGAGKCSTAAGITARSQGQALTTTTTDGEVTPVRINLPNLNGVANT